MSRKISIVCVHCSQMFEKTGGTSGNGVIPLKHTPGCGKVTRVHFRKGEIFKTTK